MTSTSGLRILKTFNNKKPFSIGEWLFGLTIDRRMFVYGLVFGLPAIILVFIYPYLAPFIGPDQCRFLSVTGFYCPGCGCTRAVRAMTHGHFIASFLYNPTVLYCMVIWILYEGSHMLEILHVPHIKGMKFRYGYIYAGIVVLFGNWIIKNILLYIVNYRF